MTICSVKETAPQGAYLDCSHSQGKQNELLAQIRLFVARTSGLRECGFAQGSASFLQTLDGHSLCVRAADLDDILFRTDTDGQDFIQVNFREGKKILITDSLIGFKPAVLAGLDMAKLPRVVTTPDILSVFEALQEALYVADPKENDLTVLRKVFDAVVSGGEAVGFNLVRERSWLGRIPSRFLKVTA